MSAPIELPPEGRDLNRDMAAMVKHISEIGPKIPEIARRMGRHKETVRYWYKKLQEHDFVISAIINYEALGLKRIAMKVRFGDGYGDYVRPLTQAMNELCYVMSYSRALPGDTYVVTANLPQDYAAEFVDFMETLRTEGVFKTIEYYSLDWVSNKPMQADLYDFEHGTWEVDFHALMQPGSDDGKYAEPPISPKVKFDRIDLLIAKELMSDATRELQDIQRAIKEADGVDINYKTLCWHLSEHVEPRLIKGYKINWMGTKYDPVTDRAKHRQHSYLGVDVFAKSVRTEERMELLNKIGRLPVVWLQGAGSDYYAQVMIPSESTVEGLQYLQTALQSVSDRASFVIADQRDALTYQFSYKLYDETAKAWKFNREELLAKFKALEAQIR